MLRRCVSLDTLKTKSASIMRDSKSDWSARLAHKPLGVDGGQFYAIGLQSSNSQGLEEEFHVFPIMKGPLQYSEEINGELPFFMPAHLLAVGSDIRSQRARGFYERILIHTRCS